MNNPRNGVPPDGHPMPSEKDSATDGDNALEDVPFRDRLNSMLVKKADQPRR